MFELVSTGEYTLTAPGSGVNYTIAPTAVVVGASDVLVDLVAVPRPGAGNYLAGNIENNHGQKMGGITVVLESLETGAVSSILTLEDGAFSFMGLAVGDYKVYPLESGLEAVPKNRTFHLESPKTDLSFIFYDEPVIVSGDINDDNVLDVKDVIPALGILVGTNQEIDLPKGDVNNDGRIDLTEPLHLIQEVIGGF